MPIGFPLDIFVLKCLKVAIGCALCGLLLLLILSTHYQDEQAVRKLMPLAKCGCSLITVGLLLWVITQ